MSRSLGWANPGGHAAARSVPGSGPGPGPAGRSHGELSESTFRLHSSVPCAIFAFSSLLLCKLAAALGRTPPPS